MSHHHTAPTVGVASIWATGIFTADRWTVLGTTTGGPDFRQRADLTRSQQQVCGQSMINLTNSNWTLTIELLVTINITTISILFIITLIILITTTTTINNNNRQGHRAANITTTSTGPAQKASATQLKVLTEGASRSMAVCLNRLS